MPTTAPIATPWPLGGVSRGADIASVHRITLACAASRCAPSVRARPSAVVPVGGKRLEQRAALARQAFRMRTIVSFGMAAESSSPNYLVR